MARINGTSSANSFGFYANVTIGNLDNTTQKFPVTVDLYLVNHGTRTNSSNWTKSITCDGVTTSATAQTINTTGVSRDGGETKVYTASFNVDIKSTITVSAYLSKSSYTQYDPGRCSLSGTVSMPKVASTWNSSLLAIPDVEGTFELPINKYVGEYTNVVTISNLNMTTTVKTINNAEDGDSVTFTSGELNTIYAMDNNPNKNPVTFYMNLYTYDTNNNQVGSVQRLTCDAGLVNAEPTATYTIVEQDPKVISLLGGSTTSKIIQNASDLLFTITATALKGSSITSVKINDEVATYDSDTQTYKLNVTDIVTGTYNIMLTDSRGLTQTYTATKEVISYLVTSISSNWTVNRAGQTSSNLILNAKLTCYSSQIDGNTNTPTVQYSSDNSNWTTIPSTDYTFANDKVTITNVTLSNVISHQTSGTFYLKISDLLTEANDNKIVAVGIYTFAKSDRKVRINGTLEIADEDAQNRFEIRKPITYSSSETFVGYWTDGKPIYRKVIDFGTLPNNTTKNVAHNISNLKSVVKLEGIATFTSGGVQGWMSLPLQYVGSNSNYNVQLTANATNVIIQANTDRSSYSATIYIEYTKTTD